MFKDVKRVLHQSDGRLHGEQLVCVTAFGGAVNLPAPNIRSEHKQLSLLSEDLQTSLSLLAAVTAPRSPL